MIKSCNIFSAYAQPQKCQGKVTTITTTTTTKRWFLVDFTSFPFDVVVDKLLNI